MKDNSANKDNFWYQVLMTILTCIIIGIVGGLFGAAFHYLLDFANYVRCSLPFVIYFLPLGGLLIALLFKKAKIGEYFNTEKVYNDAKKSEKVSFWLAPVIYLSSFITHIFGGSAGREGASIAIGGSIGSDFARLFKHPNEKRYLFIIAGMSATFSGILAVPMTAVIFSIEATILYKKKGFTSNALAFLCSSVSSLFGYLIAIILRVEPLSYGKISLNFIDFKTIMLTILLIFIAIIISIVFKLMIHHFRNFYNKIGNFYLRIFSGGVFVVCITLLIGSQRYSGAGNELIFQSFSGSAEPYDFILKLILTVLTMGCGFCGGEMIPAMVIGATFGFALSTILPIPIEIAVCVSLITVFSVFMRTPVAGFILAFEVFGISGWIYYILIFIPALAYTLLVSKFNKKIEA